MAAMRSRGRRRDFVMAQIGRELRGPIPSRRLAVALVAADVEALAEAQRMHSAATEAAFIPAQPTLH